MVWGSALWQADSVMHLQLCSHTLNLARHAGPSLIVGVGQRKQACRKMPLLIWSAIILSLAVRVLGEGVAAVDNADIAEWKALKTLNSGSKDEEAGLLTFLLSGSFKPKAPNTGHGKHHRLLPMWLAPYRNQKLRHLCKICISFSGCCNSIKLQTCLKAYVVRLDNVSC